MFDEYQFDTAQWDHNQMHDLETLTYFNSDFWVDFWEGFSVPNYYIKNCMFKYLTPLSTSYDVNRIDYSHSSEYNLLKTQWSVEISGRIIWKNRADLVLNFEKFKRQVRDKKEVIIKDDWLERIFRGVIETIEPDENHYNHTWMRYKIILSYRHYRRENTTQKVFFDNNTSNSSTHIVSNPWLETDVVWILKYTWWSNLTVWIEVNWISFSPWENVISSWDEILFDTQQMKVLVNWQEIVFDGMLENLIPWENTIHITDDGTSRKYHLTIFYKKSIP